MLRVLFLQRVWRLRKLGQEDVRSMFGNFAALLDIVCWRPSAPDIYSSRQQVEQSTFLIIEDDNHIVLWAPALFAGFIGHACRDWAVTNDRDDMVFFFKSRATAIPRPAEIEVELCPSQTDQIRFRSLVKPDKPSGWRMVGIRSRPTGQHFEGVGFGVRTSQINLSCGVSKSCVQCHGQLYHAQTCAQMPACLWHGIN